MPVYAHRKKGTYVTHLLYLDNGETTLAEILLHLLALPVGLGLLLLQVCGSAHKVLGFALHFGHEETSDSELFFNLASIIF